MFDSRYELLIMMYVINDIELLQRLCKHKILEYLLKYCVLSVSNIRLNDYSFGMQQYIKSVPDLKILVVDVCPRLRGLICFTDTWKDDNINRTILCKRLRSDGHDVVPATNGQEGLELVENDRSFDAILMDIQ